MFIKSSVPMSGNFKFWLGRQLRQSNAKVQREERTNSFTFEISNPQTDVDDIFQNKQYHSPHSLLMPSSFDQMLKSSSDTDGNLDISLFIQEQMKLNHNLTSQLNTLIEQNNEILLKVSDLEVKSLQVIKDVISSSSELENKINNNEKQTWLQNNVVNGDIRHHVEIENGSIFLNDFILKMENNDIESVDYMKSTRVKCYYYTSLNQALEILSSFKISSRLISDNNWGIPISLYRNKAMRLKYGNVGKASIML